MVSGLSLGAQCLIRVKVDLSLFDKGKATFSLLVLGVIQPLMG